MGTDDGCSNLQFLTLLQKLTAGISPENSAWPKHVGKTLWFLCAVPSILLSQIMELCYHSKPERRWSLMWWFLWKTADDNGMMSGLQSSFCFLKTPCFYAHHQTNKAREEDALSNLWNKLGCFTIVKEIPKGCQNAFWGGKQDDKLLLLKRECARI